MTAADVDTALLLFVTAYTEQHGRRPCLREIAEARGLDQWTVRRTLLRLEAAGRIRAPFVVAHRGEAS